CGNTVILKGSENCPRTHQLIVEAFADAGFPPGVVNYITNAPADAAAVVQAMVAHPAVRRVNFTGSTKVGRLIALTCAKYLKDAKREFVIIESSDKVGGRVRTDLVDGFQLDRGFQVFLTSYPEALKVLDYDKLQFQKLPSGARIRRGKDYFVLPNPLKDLFTAPQAAFSPIGNLFDKVNVLRLNFATSNAAEPNRTANGDIALSTLSFLEKYGYSDKFVKSFFKPFFGGVFLDKELTTRSDFFKFLYHHFAIGEVVIPSAGIQAIAEQIAGFFIPTELRLNSNVEKINGKTVQLTSGEEINADKIVVATDAAGAARLLGERLSTEFNGTSCIYFTSDKPLNFSGKPFLIINSNKSEMINHILEVSAIAPSYSPQGKTLISVNLIGNSYLDAEILVKKVLNELTIWFGDEYEWRHLKTYRIPAALPRFDAKFKPLPAQVTENIYRCGDYTAYPSLNAAMKSGREVAEMLCQQT
ncbi:MAG: aldehyde dehydrogenase family protein, partial [Pyrinomonadaceae bacterium]|nr:aldehyde dehydrogenase family protein [Pyrinomonadaceae bacterium]